MYGADPPVIAFANSIPFLFATRVNFMEEEHLDMHATLKDQILEHSFGRFTCLKMETQGEWTELAHFSPEGCSVRDLPEAKAHECLAIYEHYCDYMGRRS